MPDILAEDIRASKYVIYARKSDEDSEKQVRSIEDQIKECRDYAERLKLNVVDEITEEGSAKKPFRRKKFTELMERIEKGQIDGILSWHPDRLARNMMEGGRIVQFLDDAKLTDLKFSSFHFTNDASGKMMLGIAFALSKHYSEKLSVDVRRGNMNALKEGKSAGQYKPGYIRDSKSGLYYREENNFPIVEEAWRMKLAKISEEKIVAMMSGYRRVIKKENTKLKREQPMTVQKLNDMFRDPIYYGVLRQKNDEIDLTQLYEFETMITKEEFDVVQRMRRGHRKQKVKMEIPYRGLVLCNHCGKARVPTASLSRNKKDRFIYYRCDTPDCPERGKSVRGEEILAAIVDVLGHLSADRIDRDDIERLLREQMKTTQKDATNELKRLKTERTKAEKELDEMTTRRVKGTFDQAELAVYDKEKARLRDVIDHHNRRISELEVQEVFTIVNVEKFLNTLKTAAEDYEDMDHTHKDIIARMLILNIKTERRKVASVSLNPPFDELVIGSVFSTGGPGGI